jgi:hypothetical protein
MTILGHCNATFRWLSLHAAVYVEPDDREGLMSLFRYCLRRLGAVSHLLVSFKLRDAGRSRAEHGASAA